MEELIMKYEELMVWEKELITEYLEIRTQIYNIEKEIKKKEFRQEICTKSNLIDVSNERKRLEDEINILKTQCADIDNQYKQRLSEIQSLLEHITRQKVEVLLVNKLS
jgi:hypothetical protein